MRGRWGGTLCVVLLASVSAGQITAGPSVRLGQFVGLDIGHKQRRRGRQLLLVVVRDGPGATAQTRENQRYSGVPQPCRQAPQKGSTTHTVRTCI